MEDENKIIVIIASSAVLILCVLIICIIIIILCRRKRANTKYNSPLEMEEREKPDGYSPDTSNQRWPLRPGILVPGHKLQNINIIQLDRDVSPFKTTSVSRKLSHSKYAKNRPKVYAGLERLKTLLGFNGYDYVPSGLTHRSSGVVTFKKSTMSLSTELPSTMTSRKRKKPGGVPNQSSIGDKTGLGAAPPAGGIADPAYDPDKGFYENLPFHSMQNPPNKNAFYTLTAPHQKPPSIDLAAHYSATIPHPKHTKLIPRALFQEQQLTKSKSFSSKSKQKKHFQIPLQKCHSFKFQTAESYFQPIKNLHEENLMKNGYVSDYADSNRVPRSNNKRDKHKQKTNGPLVVMRQNDYQSSLNFQENVQNSVHLQYPQPGLNSLRSHSGRPNGIVYADLDMPKAGKKVSSNNSSKPKQQKHKPKTEYATLQFNDIGQEIDV